MPRSVPLHHPPHVAGRGITRNLHVQWWSSLACKFIIISRKLALPDCLLQIGASPSRRTIRVPPILRRTQAAGIRPWSLLLLFARGRTDRPVSFCFAEWCPPRPSLSPHLRLRAAPLHRCKRKQAVCMCAKHTEEEEEASSTRQHSTQHPTAQHQSDPKCGSRRRLASSQEEWDKHTTKGRGGRRRTHAVWSEMQISISSPGSACSSSPLASPGELKQQSFCFCIACPASLQHLAFFPAASSSSMSPCRRPSRWSVPLGSDMQCTHGEGQSQSATHLNWAVCSVLLISSSVVCVSVCVRERAADLIGDQARPLLILRPGQFTAMQPAGRISQFTS